MPPVTPMPKSESGASSSTSSTSKSGSTSSSPGSTSTKTKTKSRSSLAFWTSSAPKSKFLPSYPGACGPASSKPPTALVRSPLFTIKRRSYRVIMLGDAGVGKTALKTEFVQGFFAEDYDPTVEDSFMKQFVVDKGPVLMEVLDTGGHAGFATLRSSYVDSGDGYLVVFDVTNRKSFDNLPVYIREVRVAKDVDGDVPLILVANKCDLKGSQVTPEEMAEVAAYFGVSIVETSARKPWHVHEVFHEIVRLIRLAEWRRQQLEGARVAKEAKDKKKERCRGSSRTRSCTIV